MKEPTIADRLSQADAEELKRCEDSLFTFIISMSGRRDKKNCQSLS